MSDVIHSHVHTALCGSTEYPYSPRKVIGNSLGGGGEVLKAKLLEEKHEAKLEYPGGEGVQNKKSSVGGVWIYCGTVRKIESELS